MKAFGGGEALRAIFERGTWWGRRLLRVREDVLYRVMYGCWCRVKMCGKRRILLTLYLAQIPGPGGCCNKIARHIPGMPAEARIIC
jgi:hypothetical protein